MVRPIAAPTTGHAEPHAHGSWWPIITTLSIVLLLLGVLVRPLLPLGVLALLGSVWGWVREDVRTMPEPMLLRRTDRWWGVVVLIVSETVLFGALFTYYFWVRAYDFPLVDGSALVALPRFELPFIALLSAFLFTSAATAHAAETALRRGDTRRATMWLSGTVLLGLAFVLGQVYEYSHLPFAWGAGTYSTAFYALTGVHGAHVLIGTGVLATMMGLIKGGRVRSDHASGLSGAVLYWHFVDLVWVFILVVVYLRWV